MKNEIKQIISSIYEKDLSDTDRLNILIALLVKMDEVDALNIILNNSNDKMACYNIITDCIREFRNKKLGFSGHGIIMPIEQRYSENQRKKIIALLFSFSTDLFECLKIESFITSGTLLGYVRERKFLGHDDDFDMAYISKETEKNKILKERKKIFEFINSNNVFNIEERTGGRAAVFYKDEDLEFVFDLFVGYRNNEFFNEFPLEPDTVLFKDISPVKCVQFYGEKIFIPRNPEKLLEINYGLEWVKPDPSFRFNFAKHRAYYNFLLKPVREANSKKNEK